MDSGPGRTGVSARPMFAIVIATHDAAATLQRCLDSIWEQSCDDLQVVVFDGASSDETTEILEGNSDRIDFWRSETDRGVYHAWNKALVHTTGEWISFLGADDVLAGPDVMSRAANALRSVSDARVAYGSIELDDGRGERPPTLVGGPWSELGRDFAERMTLPHPAVFHHRSLFDELGLFDEGYRIGADYEFLLRELLDREPAWIPDLVVVRMSTGGLSSRPENEALLIEENLRARYRHGLVRFPPPFSGPLLRVKVRDSIAGRIGPDAARRVGNVYRAIVGKPRL